MITVKPDLSFDYIGQFGFRQAFHRLLRDYSHQHRVQHRCIDETGRCPAAPPCTL